MSLLHRRPMASYQEPRQFLHKNILCEILKYAVLFYKFHRLNIFISNCSELPECYNFSFFLKEHCLCSSLGIKGVIGC